MDVVGPLQETEEIPLPPGVEIYTSEDADLEEVVARLLREAREEILFDQFCVTSTKILKEIIRAIGPERQVMVAGILERYPGVQNYRTPEGLAKIGIPIFFSGDVGFNNNKVAIIDRTTVVTGSYDWTSAGAAKNGNNLIVIREAAIATRYRNNFLKRLSKATMVEATE